MFIVFEGVNGSGKSTQAKLLRDYLVEKGKRVLLTREPGGSYYGYKIKEILEDKKADTHGHKLDILSEFFLYCADRREHIEKVVKKALDDGMCVISDRYINSSVYQVTKGVDAKFIATVLAVMELPTPDIFFYLHVTKEIIQARRPMYQKSHLNFLEQVLNAYDRDYKEKCNLNGKEGKYNIQRIDGDAPKEIIGGQIRKNIDELFKKEILRRKF